MAILVNCASNFHQILISFSKVILIYNMLAVLDEFAKLSSIKLISLLIRQTLVLLRFCSLLYVTLYFPCYYSKKLQNLCIPDNTTIIISWRKMIIISHQGLYLLLIGSYSYNTLQNRWKESSSLSSWSPLSHSTLYS